MQNQTAYFRICLERDVLSYSRVTIHLNPYNDDYLTETLVLKIQSIANVHQYIKQLTHFSSTKLMGDYLVLFS